MKEAKRGKADPLVLKERRKEIKVLIFLLILFSVLFFFILWIFFKEFISVGVRFAPNTLTVTACGNLNQVDTEYLLQN